MSLAPTIGESAWLVEKRKTFRRKKIPWLSQLPVKNLYLGKGPGWYVTWYVYSICTFSVSSVSVCREGGLCHVFVDISMFELPSVCMWSLSGVFVTLWSHVDLFPRRTLIVQSYEFVIVQVLPSCRQLNVADMPVYICTCTYYQPLWS